MLQWVAAWNPVSVLVAAVRELFGNPTSPVVEGRLAARCTPSPASWIYCALILAIAVPAALRRYRARTID